MKRTTVTVTRKMIRSGVCADMYSCPIAEALQAAYRDNHAKVWANMDGLYLHVWGRDILAPYEVAQWVHEFDDLGDREKKPPRAALKGIKPLTFSLPPQTDPQWKDECYGCEELKEQTELDDEGYCPDCQPAESA